MIQIRDLSHVTLIVSDFEASRRFYGGVLGMDEVPTPFRHRVIWFRKGSAEIHLIHVSDASQAPADPQVDPTPERDIGRARHVAFEVEDLSETVERLKASEVEIVLGPRPRGDGVTQLYCYDPDGHLIELHSPLPG